MTDDAIILTEGLTKRFGDFTAVDALRLTVRPGSIFAFLGANGSGKSTTIRMLIGLLTPTAGRIVVDGVDVIATPRRVRDRIGYMGQKVSLYAGLTLRENMEFYAGLYGLGGAELERRWATLRERFALRESEGQQTQDLPAGIRQRAGLALSTLHAPRVLLLDEPTAGVDVESRALFWDVIREEAAAGVTVFVTTHFLEEVDYCDHVCCIDAGRVIADATPAALRAEFADGYVIDATGSGALGDVATPLGTPLAHTPPAAASSAARRHGYRWHLPALTPATLQALHDATAHGVLHDVRITELPMTEIFGRLLLRHRAKVAA